MRVWLGAALWACAPEPVSRDAADVAAAFLALHAPIYEVYDVGLDRDAVHAHVSASFTGEARTEQYVEHWRTLVAMEDDQTAIDVTAVEYEVVEVIDVTAPVQVPVDATWLVRGVVTHQRHKHPRINRYRAVYDLVETAEGWRIAATHMRDLARVATDVAPDAIFDGAEGSGAAEGFMDPMELFEGGLLGDPEEVP